METVVMRQKVNALKQVILELPQCSEGDEIEIVMVVPISSSARSVRRSVFDMAKWAEQWETDLGEDIRSTDVAGFSGRNF